MFIHHSFCGMCCQRSQISRFGSQDSGERLYLRRHLPASFSSSLPIWRMAADTSSHRWDDGNEQSKLQTWDSAVLIIRLDWNVAEVQANCEGGGGPQKSRRQNTRLTLYRRARKTKLKLWVPQITVYPFPAQQANKLPLVPPNFIQGNIPLMECF